jgi:hypothetical protein
MLLLAELKSKVKSFMTKIQIRYQIKILNAILRGKTIQYFDTQSMWRDINDIDNFKFNWQKGYYRIKPKVRILYAQLSTDGKLLSVNFDKKKLRRWPDPTVTNLVAFREII